MKTNPYDPLNKSKLPRLPWWIEDNESFVEFANDNPDLIYHAPFVPQPYVGLIDLDEPVICPGCATVFTTYTPGREDTCPFCQSPLPIGDVNVPSERSI